LGRQVTAARRRGGWWFGLEWREVGRQIGHDNLKNGFWASDIFELIDDKLATSRCQETCSFLSSDAQLLGQQCGDLAGGAALVGLDLLDRHLGAADPPRKVALRQVERLAPPPHPVAK
jgi:hypothetical protein